jgi:hypothetical protein
VSLTHFYETRNNIPSFIDASRPFGQVGEPSVLEGYYIMSNKKENIRQNYERQFKDADRRRKLFMDKTNLDIEYCEEMISLCATGQGLSGTVKKWKQKKESFLEKIEDYERFYEDKIDKLERWQDKSLDKVK